MVDRSVLALRRVEVCQANGGLGADAGRSGPRLRSGTCALGVSLLLTAAACERTPMSLSAADPDAAITEPPTAHLRLERFGIDADADGRTELVLSRSEASGTRISAVSVRSGAAIWTASVATADECDATAIEPLDDLDSDGVLDLAVLQRDRRAALVALSGRTGAELWRESLHDDRRGRTTALALVRDARSTDRFVVRSEMRGGERRVVLHELRSRTAPALLWTERASEAVHDALLVLGDLDGDGREDVALARRRGGAFDVLCISTRGGSLGASGDLLALGGQDACHFGGARVEPLGRSGVVAVAVDGVPGLTDCAARVWIHDAARGSALDALALRFSPRSASVALQLVGDVDGDAARDLLVRVGARGDGPVELSVRSARGGRQLAEWTAPAHARWYAERAAWLASVELGSGELQPGLAFSVSDPSSRAATTVHVLAGERWELVKELVLPAPID